MKHKNYFKLIAAFSLALTIITLICMAIPTSDSSVYANGGYGVTYTGGGGYPSTYFQVSLFGIETNYIITQDGKLRETMTRASEDNKFLLTIPEGTIALDENGEPLTLLEITVAETPPSPTLGATIIGPAYNFQPSGATFSPSIIITFYYEDSMIPKGVAEEELTIAYFDEKTQSWINLASLVNTYINTITTEVTHFTTFTIIGYPHFSPLVTSDLTITPDEVNIDEETTISLLITNPNSFDISYEVPLHINGVLETTQEITVAGDASEVMTFITTKDVAGTYTVTVGDLHGVFTVKTPPTTPASFTINDLTILPAEANVGENIIISALVTNTGDLTGTYKVTLNIDGAVIDTKEVTLAGNTSQKVSFTTSKDAAGTYTVNVNSLSGTLTVEKPFAFMWWPIILIIASAIIIWQYISHRRKSRWAVLRSWFKKG